MSCLSADLCCNEHMHCIQCQVDYRSQLSVTDCSLKVLIAPNCPGLKSAAVPRTSCPLVIINVDIVQHASSVSRKSP